MRLVVISDTHKTNDFALPEALIKQIKEAEIVVHSGDFTEIGFLEALKAIAKEVKAVYGNMDSGELKKILPEKLIFPIGKFKIGVTHGSGAPNNLLAFLEETFKGEELDLVIFGHSHQPFQQKIGKTIYFNPGSLFDKIFAKYNSYGI